MKKLILLACFGLLSGCLAVAQSPLDNNNSFTVMVDGKEFKTQPRRITMGTLTYFTANANKPDKSLRVWFWSITGETILKPGIYMIVDENYRIDKAQYEMLLKEKKINGLACVKYVEETREPRMEYHVGKSRSQDGGTIEILKYDSKVIEAKFSTTLDGSYWKEKATATVFGGVSRLKDKFMDKAVTAATGYDQDIDPEGNGYRRQDKKDEIVLTNGLFTLKF